MAFVKIFCWALIFLLRLRFPPGQSIADVLKNNTVITVIVFKRTIFWFGLKDITAPHVPLCNWQIYKVVLSLHTNARPHI